MCYNEAARQKKDRNKDIREERQDKSQIPRGTKIETPKEDKNDGNDSSSVSRKLLSQHQQLAASIPT